MPRRIQSFLADLYDLQPEFNVEDFLCGRRLLRATVGPQAEARGEVLLVLEDEQGVHIALYLEPAVLTTLAALAQAEVLPLISAGPESFRASCLATEGVSHLLYLGFRSDNGHGVSQLELEVQAEVDKYAAGLLGQEGKAYVRSRSRALRERLFRRPRFIDGPQTLEGRRYRLANSVAANYAATLERRYVDRGRMRELPSELRRFYRMGCREKMEHSRRCQRS